MGQHVPDQQLIKNLSLIPSHYYGQILKAGRVEAGYCPTQQTHKIGPDNQSPIEAK
jgi:hypothetical protein